MEDRQVTVTYRGDGKALGIFADVGNQGHINIDVKVSGDFPALGHAICATIEKHIKNFMEVCHYERPPGVGHQSDKPAPTIAKLGEMIRREEEAKLKAVAEVPPEDQQPGAERRPDFPDPAKLR